MTPKDFRQRKPDGNGGWEWRVGNVRRVLYRLTELLAAPADALVFLPEGERDVNSIANLGLVATTNVGGAGKWRSDYNEALRGRHVVVLPNADPPGRKHGAEVAAALEGVAASVVVLELPDLPDKGDVSNWLRAGGTVAQLLALVEEEEAQRSGKPRTAPNRAIAPAVSPISAALRGVEALTEHSAAAEREAVLRALAGAAAGADPLTLGLLREELSRKLGDIGVQSPTALADATLKAGEESTSSSVSLVADCEPWPEVVDGATLLDEITETTLRFVVLPPRAAEAIALWVLHTWCIDAAQISPRLALTSPTKRCGKSTGLKLLALLCKRPLHAANITAAVVFRVIDGHQPTLLVDEADTFLSDNEELRGIINAGHDRATATVARCQGDEHDVTLYRCFAATAIAAIGELPGTITDRSIVIAMRRRAPGEHVEPLRRAQREAPGPSPADAPGGPPTTWTNSPTQHPRSLMA